MGKIILQHGHAGGYYQIMVMTMLKDVKINMDLYQGHNNCVI
ncbi:hypothetical protein [Sphingobacterium sp. Mn56C]